MNFRKFSSVIYQYISKDSRILEFYFNTGFLVSLISKCYRLVFFKGYSIYLVTRGKRLRYKGVSSKELLLQDYIKVDIRIYNLTKEPIKISREIYIVSRLPYNIIISIDIIKPNIVNI